jgi:AraC-like DNA-binding protein
MDGANMMRPGPDETVYPVVKVATILDALVLQGVSPVEALQGVHLSQAAIASPATRVSLNQIVECYRNAVRLSSDPRFAYQTGLRFHLSSYGMFGFAILSSMNFRQTMNFAVKYHALATPSADISFKEADHCGIWTISPVPHPRVDADLYKFLVELQLGIHVSLHRDVMGPPFVPREVHLTYGSPQSAQFYPDLFGCSVLFGRSENKILFDAHWLDAVPKLGNEITYAGVRALCDELMDELQLSTGLVGKVRQVLMINLMRPTSFEAVAGHLGMSPRTLRRKLSDEGTSFRELIDELRMYMAIKYLRDTTLTIEDVAYSLGFSDAANFRHAFRRWTKAAPHQFRDISRTP